MIYKEDYYKNLNYTSYLDRGDKYIKLVSEVNSLLNSLNLLNTPILDYGCAIGHVVKAYNILGITDIIGYDVSEWAVNYGKNKNLNLTLNYNDLENHYSIGFFLDVLEHMKEQDIIKLFQDIKFDCFIFRIPVCLMEGQDYFLEVSRRDLTHNIRWTKERWSKYFYSLRYLTLPVNLSTIFDSDGVYSGLALRYM